MGSRALLLMGLVVLIIPTEVGARYLLETSTERTLIMSSKKVVTLKSSDGETFEVFEAVALESLTIKHMIEDDLGNNGILLPNVAGKILKKVIEYCKKHVETPKTEDQRTADEELKTWDDEFVKVDHDILFNLILASNYLNIKSLLDLTCQTLADMVKGKTPEEIRKIRCSTSRISLRLRKRRWFRGRTIGPLNEI